MLVNFFSPPRQVNLSLPLPRFNQSVIWLFLLKQAAYTACEDPPNSNLSKQAKEHSQFEVRNETPCSQSAKNVQKQRFKYESHDVLVVYLFLIAVCQNFLNMATFICCFLGISAFFHNASQSLYDWVNRLFFKFSRSI